jgi:hypothetical protein
MHQLLRSKSDGRTKRVILKGCFPSLAHRIWALATGREITDATFDAATPYGDCELPACAYFFHFWEADSQVNSTHMSSDAIPILFDSADKSDLEEHGTVLPLTSQTKT